jgi:hypothetical protein
MPTLVLGGKEWPRIGICSEDSMLPFASITAALRKKTDNGAEEKSFLTSAQNYEPLSPCLCTPYASTHARAIPTCQSIRTVRPDTFVRSISLISFSIMATIATLREVQASRVGAEPSSKSLESDAGLP